MSNDVAYYYDEVSYEGVVTYHVWRTWMSAAKREVAVYDDEEMARWVTRILDKAAKHEV